jgi:hypothetical protein
MDIIKGVVIMYVLTVMAGLMLVNYSITEDDVSFYCDETTAVYATKTWPYSISAVPNSDKCLSSKAQTGSGEATG